MGYIARPCLKNKLVQSKKIRILVISKLEFNFSVALGIFQVFNKHMCLGALYWTEQIENIFITSESSFAQ
jgi:hypothetical protein